MATVQKASITINSAISFANSTLGTATAFTVANNSYAEFEVSIDFSSGANQAKTVTLNIGGVAIANWVYDGAGHLWGPGYPQYYDGSASAVRGQDISGFGYIVFLGRFNAGPSQAVQITNNNGSSAITYRGAGTQYTNS